ncbi:MAG: GSU2403 family nucleotidyltransferase fold protein [Polyangiaceae bacterium]
MPLFTRHPTPLQTAYSDLKRRAQDRAAILPGTPGSVGIRTVSGRPFFYRQFYDALGKKRAEYIGAADGAKAEAGARSARDAVETAAALVKEARTLARDGYVRADPRAVAVLTALANRGLFRGGAVLVGSHAHGVLLNELGARGPAFRTEDVDVGRGKPLTLALEPEESFETLLAESFVPLFPVPGFGRKQPSTSFKARGADAFRVDLLAPARGADVGTVAVPELRAHAAALPYLAYLLREPLTGIVLGREGVVPVSVPRPEAFAWHKMLVSQLRGETLDKRAKDIEQAALLVAVLAEDAPEALAEAFDALPRSARAATRRGAARVVAILEKTCHARAREVLGEILPGA